MSDLRANAAALREELIAIQLKEPHHRKIGTRDARGRRLYLDDICRTCPSRRICRKTSVALAIVESEIV